MSWEAFEDELTALLNKHCMENGSNTPDFILARYLVQCLVNYNTISMRREDWYKVHLTPGGAR
jgi:hypothetical protein